VGWLAKIIESDRVKRAAISSLLLAQLTIMASQAVPVDFYPVTALHGKKLLTTLRDRLSGYATVLGLRQDWMMFAPNPMRENTFIDAEITYRSGRKSIWTFPQMPELGYAERYAKERYRKFANERLWVKEASFLWPDAARYIARLNREPSDPPKIVKLAHYRCIIPWAPPPGEEPPPERWEREVFFTYTVNPGDLL
jgi:hypothetical protein